MMLMLVKYSNGSFSRTYTAAAHAVSNAARGEKISVCVWGPLTSRKKGFYSSPLVPKLIDPPLKRALVPVLSKMWAREH
jgi:hypothetical protein